MVLYQGEYVSTVAISGIEKLKLEENGSDIIVKKITIQAGQVVNVDSIGASGSVIAKLGNEMLHIPQSSFLIGFKERKN